MSFWSSGFWSPGFWSNGFWGPTDEPTASSGIRRLQLMQLQEEELLKESIKEAVAKVVSVAEQSKVSVEAHKLAKQPAKLEPLVPLETFPEVKFKRKPIYTNPQPVAENFPVWLSDISLEINSWFTQLIPQWEARREVIIVAKQEAANDADIRLRLLLLAA